MARLLFVFFLLVWHLMIEFQSQCTSAVTAAFNVAVVEIFIIPIHRHLTTHPTAIQACTYLVGVQVHPQLYCEGVLASDTYSVWSISALCTCHDQIYCHIAFFFMEYECGCLVIFWPVHLTQRTVLARQRVRGAGMPHIAGGVLGCSDRHALFLFSWSLLHGDTVCSMSSLCTCHVRKKQRCAPT